MSNDIASLQRQIDDLRSEVLTLRDLIIYHLVAKVDPDNLDHCEDPSRLRC